MIGLHPLHQLTHGPGLPVGGRPEVPGERDGLPTGGQGLEPPPHGLQRHGQPPGGLREGEGSGLLQPDPQPGCGVRAVEGPEGREDLRAEPAVAASRMGVQDLPTAQGDGGRRPAEDETIPRHDHRGTAQHQLDEPHLPRGQELPIQQADPGHDLGCPVEKFDFGEMGKRPRGSLPVDQRGVEERGGREPPGDRHPVPPAELLRRDAAQVDGHPGAREGLLHPSAVGLQPPDARAAAGGPDLDLIPNAKASVPQGAGHHRPEAGHGEDPVDGQAGPAQIRRGRLALQGLLQGPHQCLQAGPGAGGDRDDGRGLPAGPLKQSADLLLHQGQPLRVHQIDLVQGDHAPTDLEEGEDGEVLPGLGHHALVGGHHQQGGVDAAHAGEHVLDEIQVAGHVHDPHRLPVRQGQPGEAQVDGHLPDLLLLQAIRVDARQRLHQRGFPVVDVACGGDHRHGGSPSFRRITERIRGRGIRDPGFL